MNSSSHLGDPYYRPSQEPSYKLLILAGGFLAGVSVTNLRDLWWTGTVGLVATLIGVVLDNSRKNAEISSAYDAGRKWQADIRYLHNVDDSGLSDTQF